ncbi:hypothetical protein Q5P01_016558 [Channa striata]|uniref:Protein kinase domain-containing protein n=1 Tax=Channa striata TaxID=64152 RepID=A0AA88SAK8_CHASR|nr:hypothetical protein Q5P01_016558 [Channa striata]
MGLTGSSNESSDDEAVQENGFLSGKLSKYRIERFLCEGGFGKVAQCIKLDTKENVAVRLMRLEGYDMDSLTSELLMSQEVRKLDPDKNNIVKLGECFYYKGFYCLVHEMVDMSIGAYMSQRDYKPLRICEIQMIAQQVLVALNALRSLGVVHRDISMNSIMLVNHQLQPFRKDFNMICAIVKTQGQPSDPLLDSGIFTKRFFEKNKNSNSSSSWKLCEDLEANREYTEKLRICSELKHIFECEDTLAFLRFLKQLLIADPKKRINASDALMSDFITKPNICRGNNPINYNNVSSIPFCYLRLLWQLEELSEESRVTFREGRTCMDDPLSADEEKHYCTNHEPSTTAKAGTSAPDYSRTAAERPLGEGGSDDSTMFKTSSLFSITHNLDISTTEYTTGFVKVKTRKTYWKRIHKCVNSPQREDRPQEKLS